MMHGPSYISKLTFTQYQFSLRLQGCLGDITSIVALGFPDPLSSPSQSLPDVPPSYNGATLAALVAVFSRPLVVPPISEGTTLASLEASLFWLPISEFFEAWLSKVYVWHAVPLVVDLSGPLFDNDRNANGRSQMKHEVGQASLNRFVVSYDLLGSAYSKVSRVEV